VNSSKPWLYGALPSRALESLHPNPTGQREIATGIVNTVKAAGWFSGYPQQPGTPVNTFNFIPGSQTLNLLPGSETTVGAQLADNSGTVYTTITQVPKLASCQNGTFTVSGWVGENRHVLQLVSTGPDTIHVNCSYPRPGDIVTNGSTSYLVTSGSKAYKLQPIPTTAVYACLAAKSGVRHYTTSKGLLLGHTVAGTASCSTP
jgi:hypothetical protein